MLYEVTLPPDFLIGASTSAHQVEGRNKNDWTDWEVFRIRKWVLRGPKANYGTGPAKDPAAIAATVRMPSNYFSGDAVMHYNLYPQDMQLAKNELAHNAYRFSIEWSRIEPTKGQYDPDAISHYVQMARTASELGLEPFVTLWHWTLPQWAAQLGGLGSPEVVERYIAYVETMVAAMKEYVHYWLTINEPEIYSMMGYLMGQWPPGKHSLRKFFRVLKTLVGMHKSAYRAIKNLDPEAQVSAAVNQVDYTASWSGRPVMKIMKYWGNDYFHSQTVQEYQDYIGLNFYMRCHVTHFAKLFDNGPELQSDMGWGLHPSSLLNVIMRAARFGKPIIITELGLADVKDELREAYLKSCLYEVCEARRQGADVRGLLIWSLLTNFEWDKGFWPDFGLVGVNRQTQERTVRGSALALAKIIEAGQFSITSKELDRWEI